MPKVTFKYCALEYLNQWLDKDRKYCDALAGNDESKKIEALTKAAGFYGVARNLHKKYDLEARYKPVLEIIESQTPAMFEGDKLLKAVMRVGVAISERYGNRDVTSLTTKFLWLKFKSPIIIYDKRARQALEAKPRDLSDYYFKWKNRFSDHVTEIDNACNSLQQVIEYSVNPHIATSSYVTEKSNQQWFKERVFDIFLWNRGAEKD